MSQGHLLLKLSDQLPLRMLSIKTDISWKADQDGNPMIMGKGMVPQLMDYSD